MKNQVEVTTLVLAYVTSMQLDSLLRVEKGHKFKIAPKKGNLFRLLKDCLRDKSLPGEEEALFKRARENETLEVDENDLYVLLGYLIRRKRLPLADYLVEIVFYFD